MNATALAALREYVEIAREETHAAERASLGLHDPQALELLIIAGLALQQLDDRLSELADDLEDLDLEGVAAV